MTKPSEPVTAALKAFFAASSEPVLFTGAAIVEAQSETIAKQLEHDGADLDSHDQKTRVKALKSLGSLEAKFFAGMSEAIEKLQKTK